MAYANPDDVRNIQLKIMVSRNEWRRIKNAEPDLGGQIGTICRADLMSRVERVEARSNRSFTFDRRRSNDIRAH